MYISEIKMHGFKSFANKEVMKLGQGITTVVGPNGCGKTNIVDAIRWVLGEQKYSVLRSGKMEDVIFNGAEGFKALGVCEVSMTVHNNSGKLPIEYNDIEIARRVYRNGDSEYYLNKTQCRLKDIMDLFLDTGMGADAYSVIELKMIEQILSETADDRRNMFEEAAGIHKYRSQRKSTIRKFDATRLDLERINDIILEVEQKVNGLLLQLKRYKRHSNLTEELKTNEISLAYLKTFRLQSEMLPVKEKIKEFKYLRESKSSETSSYQKELNELQENYKKQENELNEMQNFMSSLHKKREEIRNNIIVLSEKGKGALLTIDRLEREKTNNKGKIDNLRQLKLEFDKEILTLEPSIDELLGKFKLDKIKFDDIDILYKDKEKSLDNLQSERWELQRKLVNDRSFYDRTNASMNEKNNSLEGLKEIISNSKKEQETQLKNIKILSTNQSEVNDKLKKVNSEIATLEEKQKDLIIKRQDIVKEKYSVTAMMDSLRGQHLFYKNLVESKEGFPEGTRYVLENPNLFEGILGTVADMFEIKEEFRDALESGLGDLSHCLIADNKENAMKILKIASEKKIGDLSIIPLKESSKIKVNVIPNPKVGLRIVRAIEVVKTSKNLIPLANYLLGSLIIVDDLNIALKNEDLQNWSLVDRNGTLSGKDLVLKSRQVSEFGNLMGREEKLKEILLELEYLKKNESQLNDKFEKLDKFINENKLTIKKSIEEKQHFKSKLLQIDSDLLRKKLIDEQSMKTLKISQIEIFQLQKDIKNLKLSIETLKPKIKKFEEKIDSYQKKINTADQEMLKYRSMRDDAQSLLQESRIQLIELESRRDQVSFKKKSGEESRDELKQRIEKLVKEIFELKEQKEKLDKDINLKEKELNLSNAEIQKQRSILELKQEVFRETFLELEQIQSKIASDQKNKEQILEDLKNLELDLSRNEQTVIAIKEKISEKYYTILPDHLVVDETEEQLEIIINKIQRSLENIGPVNMAVQDEHREEDERLQELCNQRNDLIKAEEHLRETIRKIDKVARKRFQETFVMIKLNFEKLFNLFFEGGNATLKLIGDPDPLEADIGIEAQPPGKKNTSLRLLSSGEKALTAISLLFAIYQVKPSPYCILDEVDAPLDDINVRKFTKVLSKFCDKTQFIIVTHNKLTMETADFMYGVTQEKKGVSKLVSVKFD